jgi:hypothetical protein
MTSTPATSGGTAPSPAVPRTQTEAQRYQRLRAHLAFLKLLDAAQALPGILDAARTEKLSATATLERLFAVEVTAVEQRRLTSRLRFACLPARPPYLDHNQASSAFVAHDSGQDAEEPHISRC